MKKWKCLRCGYIHLGEKPPERCPVCGAPKEKFELVLEETADATAATETAADILVVGSGAAAFAAAITAKNRGASVIMLEKAMETGGTTARSGGGYWIPNNPFQKAVGYTDDRERCLKYMARYSYPHLYNQNTERYGLPARAYALLAAYYDNAHRMIAHFEESGALHSMVEINWTGKPQVDYMDHLPENGGIRGRSIYPKGQDGTLGYGDELIRQLSTYAGSKGVTILTGCEARRILRGGGGQVTGLAVLQGGEERVYHANKGVIFGSGGFSHDAELMLSLQRGPHFGGCSVPTNTGDFIRMAGEIGAMLGNTAGAFRADSMIEAALAHPGGSSNLFYIAGDSVLIANKHGKRIVDEKRNYTDRAMLHFVWDAQQAEWVNMITVLLYDARTAALWQGFPPYPVQGDTPDYLMRADSLEALTEEITARLHRLAPRTGGFSLGDDFLVNLKKTVADFNAYARDGLDMEFQRGSFAYDREWTTFPPTVPGAAWPDADAKNYTMHPLNETGPYFAILLCAGTLDTNGGPVVDEHARVLDWSGTPIPGLYGAGNCIASPTANAYWGAGSTIGPAMTFGYLAALDATRT